jgi:hypothetical protein
MLSTWNDVKRAGTRTLEASDANTDLLSKVLSDNLFQGSFVSVANVSVANKWITDLYVPSILWISGTFYFYDTTPVSIALCIRQIDV